MKENTIFKLENNEKYLILDKIEYGGSIYYFSTMVEPYEKFIEKKIKFFIEKKENNNFYLGEVTDKETLTYLIDIVKKLTTF